MGGLGLGERIAGEAGGKHPAPLAFYARLEFLIAISAALTPALIWLIRAAYIASGRNIRHGSIRWDDCPVAAGGNRPGRSDIADGWDTARDGEVRRQ